MGAAVDHLQCSECLKSLAVCECGPAWLRGIQNSVFSEKFDEAKPELSPESAAEARLRVQAAIAKHGKVFVQNAWRHVVDGIPDGYVAVPYPKFQRHADTGEERIVQTREEHLALYASDCRWELAPEDDLLAMFLKELS